MVIGLSECLLLLLKFKTVEPVYSEMNHNPQENRNQQCTIYVGSLAPEVTETILWELMIQAGPLGNDSDSKVTYFI